MFSTNGLKLLLLLLVFAQPGIATAADRPSIVHIKLIAFNDLHGHLAAPHMSVRAPDGAQVPAGGVARMASLIAQLRNQNPNHAVLSAGDMVGASPLVSAWFLDEPTIEAMNFIGVDFNAVGNHEFDQGIAELERKQTGGCARPGSSMVAGNTARQPCSGGHIYEGAKFPFLAANVFDNRSGRTLFPAYGIKNFDGIKVAFIGLTLRGTPFISTPANVRGYRFSEEADTINALIPELKAQGVQVFVVLIHQGGHVEESSNGDTCAGLKGDIVPIVKHLDPAVSVVISGHTHQAYICELNDVLLTSAASYGRLVTDIDLDVERASGKLLKKNAVNRIVVSDAYDKVALPSGYVPLPKDPVIEAHVQRYAALVKPLAERVVYHSVGPIGTSFSNVPNDAGESALGDLVADAQLFATRESGAQLALVNPGGLRADLRYGSDEDGRLTYAEIFAAQPFGNRLLTLALSGAQIQAVLEQQFNARRDQPLILQVSSSLQYAYDMRRKAGDRIVPGSLKLNGMALDMNRIYRVTVNDYLAAAGDGFSAFKEADERRSGMLDVDALAAYLQAHSGTTLKPGPLNRITRIDVRIDERN